MHFKSHCVGLLRVCTLALLIAGSYAQSTSAQRFPNKPIRIEIAFAAGNLADIIARVVTDKMAVSLGQPFVLENKPGAGGNLAMEFVARSAPDGHTLLLAGPSVAINGSLYKNLSFNPKTDLTPVSLLGLGPFALYVSGTLPVNNTADLIAYAKARPGQLNYASVGIGSGGHLTAVLFALAAGIDMTHVPYKGQQQSAPDLVSGQIHLTFNAFGPFDQFLQSGKIKLIGMTGSKRLSHFPNVPTLSESGLPGFEAAGWYMLFAPAGTPRDVLARLDSELVKAYGDHEVFDRVNRTNMQPVPQTLDEASRFMATEIEKWARAVKASGATAE